MARSDLGYRQGDSRPAVDTVLHCVPDAHRNVKEAFLTMPALGTHKTDGDVRSLVVHLQLRLQL